MHCASGTVFLQVMNLRDCWYHLISRWHFLFEILSSTMIKLCINQEKGDIGDIFAYNTEEIPKTSYPQGMGKLHSRNANTHISGPSFQFRLYIRITLGDLKINIKIYKLFPRSSILGSPKNIIETSVL